MQKKNDVYIQWKSDQHTHILRQHLMCVPDPEIEIGVIA